MSTLSRLTLAASIAGLLLSGCADRPATRATTPSTVSTTRPATSVPRPSASQSVRRSTVTPAAAPDTTDTSTSITPGTTGIPACDDYLSSYLACHRAAQIFAPDQLQSRYDAMRTSLLHDSQNPDIRPQLGARCNSLASQLRQALHGKSCATDPATSSSP